MHITVRVREVYGKDLVYPADVKAQVFAHLVGAKTFNRLHIDLIRSLGYTVEVAAGTLPAGWEA